MSNMAQLYTIYNAKAQSSIGSNDMFKYENIKPLIPAQTANIDKTDDDTDWMMHSQKNMPYIMTDYSKLVRSDYSKLVINVSDLSSLFSTQLFQDLFNMSIDNLSVIIQYDNDTLKSDRLKYGGSNPNSLTPSYIPGQIYNGSSFKGNLQQIFHEDLEPNDVEKSIFNYILYKLFFTNDADWFTSTMARSSSLWAYNLLTDQNNANANFLDIKIYDLFHQQEQEQELNLSSTYSYALEFYKFKYYLSHQLMGYYGTDDITTQNYESTQKEEIIVPWSQYFKFCFLPQYNAYTCRCADELNSKFDDSSFLVELKKLDEDIEQKNTTCLESI